jgi:hypothetical protein
VAMTHRTRIGIVISMFVVAFTGGAIAQPLPCEPASPKDVAPWDHNSAVLSSFPPSVPPPVYVGDFKDEAEDYWLDIWRDERGVFGQLSHPVFEADSPTSRLYDVVGDRRMKQLSFRAVFPEGDVRMSAIVQRRVVRATITAGSSKKQVVLRKFRWDAMSWASREQFDCAMKLWHRY